jgi:hypothetical protein
MNRQMQTDTDTGRQGNRQVFKNTHIGDEQTGKQKYRHLERSIYPDIHTQAGR